MWFNIEPLVDFTCENDDQPPKLIEEFTCENDVVPVSI